MKALFTDGAKREVLELLSLKDLVRFQENLGLALEFQAGPGMYATGAHRACVFRLSVIPPDEDE
jgi:hypothetical protein